MDEYILKLQIHQHSLLTRRLFSRHNLSAQVFFSVSSGSSSSPHHLRVIFIFKSYSSLNLDNQSIWIIITGSRSSLDLDHHYWIFIAGSGSSPNLDHHSIWIITAGSSSLDLDHHSIWIISIGSTSLDLDHHCWIWIITRFGSSQGHHQWI